VRAGSSGYSPAAAGSQKVTGSSPVTSTDGVIRTEALTTDTIMQPNDLSAARGCMLL